MEGNDVTFNLTFKVLTRQLMCLVLTILKDGGQVTTSGSIFSHARESGAGFEESDTLLNLLHRLADYTTLYHRSRGCLQNGSVRSMQHEKHGPIRNTRICRSEAHKRRNRSGVSTTGNPDNHAVLKQYAALDGDGT